MQLPTGDVSRGPNADAKSRALIEACSIEIGAQATLLWAVILPTAVLIFPAALLGFCLYVAAHAVGELSANLEWIGSFAEQEWWSLLLAGGTISLVIAGSELLAGHSSAYLRSERRLRPLSGVPG